MRAICSFVYARSVRSAYHSGFLFFQRIEVLLIPGDRTREHAKWGLVVAMFSFVTIFTAMNLDLRSISYINNRESPGASGESVPGPLGYKPPIYSKAVNVVPYNVFFLNQWLADGLLVGSVPNSPAQCLTSTVSPALPLLRYLCHELLGHRLLTSHVPRFLEYVLSPS